MRDKLKKVVKEAIHSWDSNVNMSDHITDHLITNGATIQKWIPVMERLPDTQEYDWVLAQITMKPSCIFGVPVVAELRGDGIWYDAYDNPIGGKYEKVTHWMPLPEPPGDCHGLRPRNDGEVAGDG